MPSRSSSGSHSRWRGCSTTCWRRAASPRTRSSCADAWSICGSIAGEAADAVRRQMDDHGPGVRSRSRSRAAVGGRRRRPPAADPRQSAEQRRQVHAARRPRLAARRTRRRASLSFACSDRRRRNLPADARLGVRPVRASRNARSIAPAAGSASGSRWCAPWSRCTAAPSARRATARARGASSWCACR